jgi:hypothetical protein
MLISGIIGFFSKNLDLRNKKNGKSKNKKVTIYKKLPLSKYLSQED